MGQVIDEVSFMCHDGMKVRVVHEGDLYRVVKMAYDANGRETHCKVVLERMVNNAAITRLKDD